MAMLKIENLSKTYKSRKVVQDVSLEVESGEIIGLLGPNGAGKTTSFYMIVGLVKSEGGSIFLGTEDLSKFSIDVLILLVLKLAHLFGKIAISKFLKGISVGKFNSAPGQNGQYSFGGNAVLPFLVAE